MKRSEIGVIRCDAVWSADSSATFRHRRLHRHTKFAHADRLFCVRLFAQDELRRASLYSPNFARPRLASPRHASSLFRRARRGVSRLREAPQRRRSSSTTHLNPARIRSGVVVCVKHGACCILVKSIPHSDALTVFREM